jgi:hypothetical protein
MRNVVKKFYWNHIYDCRVSIQHVPVLRLCSSWIPPLPLKKRITLSVGKNHRHNSHQNHSGHCPPTYGTRQFTHLEGPQMKELQWNTTTHQIPLQLTSMLVFLTTIQMGHSLWDQLTDYWAQTDQFYTPFYSTTTKWNRYLHNLWFLHFMDNRNGVDRMEEN